MKASEQDLELIRRYLAGDLPAEECTALGQRLKEDAALRDDFLAYARVDAALGSANLEPVAASWSEAARKPARFGLIGWPVAIAALVLLALFLRPNTPTAPPSFATLMATTDAHWSDPNVELALNSGERVTSALRLESGHAEFQMADGATVAVDGPATVHFAERKVVRVDEGRVLCKCPTPESRITVITPQTRIVDLGTEFSVDARADASTRVAVLSGKVQVMSRDAGVLTAGEVVEVKRDQVVRLQPLSAGEIAALTRKATPSAAGDEAGKNLLADPGFEQPLPSALWRGTDDCLEPAAAGRSGRAVRVRAESKSYPIVKQRVSTGDISGKVVQAAVWAMSRTDDPISARQFAVVKLAFLNAEGREFACSARHFLHKGQPANTYVPAQIAAQAPAGTRSVELQLILGASREKGGSVCFDDAALWIADGP